MSKEGNGSFRPMTVIELFENTVKNNAEKESLFIERGGKWVSWTWDQYINESRNFAKALISIGIPPFKSVNILASNCPEWMFSFIGGIYGQVIPVGIYITNNTETCMYIADHSECGCLVVDSISQYKKYEKDLTKLNDLKVVVFIGDVNQEEIAKLQTNAKEVKLITWSDFIKLGKNSNLDKALYERISNQKPGHCCNIVYTSGTTGPPKAVMLSHDNMTWTGNSLDKDFGHIYGREGNKGVSYLPLSHIASQFFDIICNKYYLIKYLLYVLVKFISLDQMLYKVASQKHLSMSGLQPFLEFLEFMRNLKRE